MLIVRIAPISASNIRKDRIKNSFRSILFFLLAPVQPSRPKDDDESGCKQMSGNGSSNNNNAAKWMRDS